MWFMILSIIFYRIFLLLYKLGIRLVAPWNRKARSWLDGRRGLFRRMKEELAAAEVGRAEVGRRREDKAALSVRQEGRYRSDGEGSRPVIWMHCSSLGEF